MSTRCIAWMTVVLIGLSAGCAPILFYQARQTRSYEYEKRVPVLVNSYPAGATIVAADGRILGQAPLIVEEAVRVRREHRYCSSCMAILGCAVDVTAMALASSYSLDHPNSRLAQVAWGVGFGMEVGCFSIVTTQFLKSLTLAIGTPPRRHFMSALPSDREVMIRRSVYLVARWDGLGESRVRLVLPGARTTTLRLPRRYTFDEALVMWAQETSPPPTAENLYAIGSAYLELARQGVATARGHARSYFSLYVQLYPDGAQAEAARQGLAEVERFDREGK